jgi:3-oxoacyl-[acyl-carrier protein] reductase
MDLGIAGRKAIVCASSRGLGKGCALALAEAGCDVVINGRSDRTLGATAEEIRSRFNVRIVPVVADVSTSEGQKALLAACPDPDILVNNNAGPPRRHFTALDRDAMIGGVIQNMVTPIELIQAVIRGMAERGFGRIVNITSGSVVAPIEGLDLSSGARAGLTAFVAGVCREFADRNVTVNNILPGKMDTDRFNGGLKTRAEKAGISVADALAESLSEIPAHRLGTKEEFGQLCAFLASKHAGYITGRNFLVDGGLFPGAF